MSKIYSHYRLFRINEFKHSSSILLRQMAPLMHKSFLSDVVFVCRDGTVTAIDIFCLASAVYVTARVIMPYFSCFGTNKCNS